VVRLKDDELAVFSWIVFKSRRRHDAVNAKVMTNPRMAGMEAKAMALDGKRMFWGGFKQIVSL